MSSALAVGYLCLNYNQGDFLKYNNKLHTVLAVTAVFLCVSVFSGCSLLDELGFSDNSQISQTVTSGGTVVGARSNAYSGYGFSNLEREDLQNLYEMLDQYANKSSVEKIVADGTFSVKEISQALEAYKNDNPQVFWLDDTFEYSHFGSKTGIILSFIYDGDELSQMKQNFDAKVSEIIANAPTNSTDYDVELYINDYIVDNCQYDKEGAAAADNGETLGNEHNAYGALIDQKAVCDGYSAAFQLLCNKLGIECVSIQGTSKDEPHMWNGVKINNEWYHTDVTWNDSDEYVHSERYFYLNLTTEQIKADHTINLSYGEVSDDNFDENTIYNIFVPSCTSQTYNYFNASCPKLTNINGSDEIVTLLAQTAAQRGEDFDVVIDEGLDFQTTVDSLASDGYIYNWLEKANAKNGNNPKISDKSKLYNFSEHRLLTIKLQYE